MRSYRIAVVVNVMVPGAGVSEIGNLLPASDLQHKFSSAICERSYAREPLNSSETRHDLLSLIFLSSSHPLAWPLWRA